jgi:hypothetical protein
MKCWRKQEMVGIEFDSAERQIFVQALQSLRAHYQLDEAEVSERAHRYWRGKLFTEEAHDPEDKLMAEELAEARWALRAERLNCVEAWLEGEAGLLRGKAGALKLTIPELDQFLKVLNDRRLLLAAEFSLTEELLEEHPQEVASLEVQHALWEVHFLAFVQQGVLELLSLSGD